MDEAVEKIGRAAIETFQGGSIYLPSDDETVGRCIIAAVEAAGWRVVPEEPTEEMVIAGCRHEEMGDMAGRYKAMLAARPRLNEKED